MSQAKETGFEVRKGFIEPELACSAASLASILKNTREPFVRPLMSQGMRQGQQQKKGLAAFLIDPKAMSAFDRRTFSDLLELSSLAEPLVGSAISSFLLHFYRPAASSGKQRDDYSSRTVTIDLAGLAVAHFKDPATNVEQAIGIRASDAIIFNSAGPPEQRLEQHIENVSNIPMIAWVNPGRT